MLGSSMVDRATPNLPSRHFDARINFYAALGFTVGFRDAGWLILDRGHLILEFFPYENLNPATSSFGSCLRLDDLDAFYRECLKAGTRAHSASRSDTPTASTTTNTYTASSQATPPPPASPDEPLQLADVCTPGAP